MSENYIDYAQKLRQQAEALLSIAEQLEREAQQETRQATDPPTWTRDRPANTNATEMAKWNSSQILLSQDKYQICHIRVSESEERFPALLVDQNYYSLARVFSEIKQVLAVKAKLEWSGEITVLTKIATGYALWILEPNAKADDPAVENSTDPETDLVEDRDRLYVVKVSDSPNREQVSLKEYLLVFNQLSEWTNRYLGSAVVVHYWQSTRPELKWLEQFEVVGSGKIICRNLSHLPLNSWQEEQLQLWLQQFSQRCRRVIPQFPQGFLSEYKSHQLLANLLDEDPSPKDKD